MKKNIFKFFILVTIMVSGCSTNLIINKKINDELKYQSKPVLGNFLNFTYVENHAIAFGFFNSIDRKLRMPVIFILPTCVTVLCFIFVWKVRNKKFRLLLPVFVLLGGAYGNIIDRAMHGFVTDFLHVHYYDKYHFYVFNVADVLVNIGIILMLMQFKQFNKLLEEAFSRKPKIKNEINNLNMS